MKNNFINKRKEFEIICKDYLFPLIGVPYGGFEEKENDYKSSRLIDLCGNELKIFESIGGTHCYTIKVNKFFPDSCLGLLNTVFSILNNDRSSNQYTKRYYSSELDFRNRLNFSIQKAICNWITDGDQNSNKLEELINELEIWKSKTYEGKSVNFAFSYNYNINEECDLDFLDFLKEEYSATFTDGITSIIKLDKNLHFIGYKSITSLQNNNYIRNYDVGPLRFADVMNNFTDNEIGVFLLGGGDIILTKNRQIKLVKREGKWLNFSKEVFASFVSSLFDLSDSSFNDLCDQIYLSSLDVSFSHSGGIIAFVLDSKLSSLIEPDLFTSCVLEGNDDKNEKVKPVLSFMDNFDISFPNDKILKQKNFNYFNDPDTIKRLNKRKYLKTVIGNVKFNKLDRKLRCELISMDGATIIKEDGTILSVGAIIQNDSGSYGGGRGAAAKKLSDYGFAIKISTDGYIECYKDKKRIFKIK